MSAASDPAPTRRSTAAYTGLLNDLMANTLDRDYAVVAEQRGVKPGRGQRRRQSSMLTVAAVIAVFGIMVTVSAIRTAHNRPAATAQRAKIVAQVHARQRHLDALNAQLGRLETQVATLQRAASSAQDQQRSLNSSIDGLGATTGAAAVTGPGVSILTDNARGAGSSTEGGVILDTDLQTLVNALWQAGAEAVAINGHRVTSLTSIRYAGDAITVDYRSLTPPYRVEAIGDPDTLEARLQETPGGQEWSALARDYGITYQVSTLRSLRLPGVSVFNLGTARIGGTP